MNALGFNVTNGWRGAYPFGNPVWGTVTGNKRSLTFNREKVYRAGQVPDVHGMGARDAVYMMEKRGIRVRLNGRGKVLQQSLAPGDKVKKGMVCSLQLG